MRIVNPGEIIRLWIVFLENGIKVSGLTDMTVEGRDENDNIILSERPLQENGTTGEYYYMWDTNNIDLEKFIRIFYKKNGEILDSEGYFFDVLEDADGQAV